MNDSQATQAGWWTEFVTVVWVCLSRSSGGFWECSASSFSYLFLQSLAFDAIIIFPTVNLWRTFADLRPLIYLGGWGPASPLLQLQKKNSTRRYPGALSATLALLPGKTLPRQWLLASMLELPLLRAPPGRRFTRQWPLLLDLNLALLRLLPWGR